MTERPCVDCGEPTLNPERCRDCDITRSLDRMQCSQCERMRYRVDTPMTAELGAYFWGEPCSCDPKPPTVADLKRA